jgi:hypothetical protein
MNRRAPPTARPPVARPTLPAFRLACQQFEALARRDPAFWWALVRALEAHARTLEAIAQATPEHDDDQGNQDTGGKGSQTTIAKSSRPRVLRVLPPKKSKEPR